MIVNDAVNHKNNFIIEKKQKGESKRRILPTSKKNSETFSGS